MRSLVFALAAATAIATISPLLVADTAGAMTPDGLRAPVGRLDVIEDAQYRYGGRRYCWYDEGWHGGGWYWCGHASHRGYGWGGSEGWHGWERRHEERHEGRY
jgi:hypothetical protein